MLEYVSFGGGLLCTAVVLSGFCATVIRPPYRFWPPGSDERKRRVYLVCSRGSLLSILATAVLDAGSVTLPLWGRVAGGALVVLAIGLLSKAAADLGREETEGRVGELRTDGLYRYTRNPQNLGYVLLFWAISVASASLLVVLLSGVMTVWLMAQSFIEEPWLRSQYEGYAEYARDVPRFVGVRSIRRGVQAIRSTGIDGDS